MRNRVAQQLVRMAKRIVFDEDIVFVRDADTNDRVLNELWRAVGTYLDRVRRNEDIETYTARSDNNSAMEISIGIKEHEKKDAILKAVVNHAKKLGRRMGVRVIAEDMRPDREYRHQ